MPRVVLGKIALARSGDKGNSSNIGVIARTPAIYEFLRRELTGPVVREVFREICKGEVTRYELPNLLSLNFVLRDSLGGGGTRSLITDPQGKVHGAALLHMELEVPAELLP
ncbi:hypothetical protein E2F43_12490 [Seongchinamella unica]|uniref:AtuA-like ferredoxin-fold domain-containing protein n=1 Tax=Seongchinamella unica TaxID=2547392 RepID=A0A4R5LPF1_9GAMM|nr:hypothetical protein [Seongchinamella unica]TDG12422.1 hypothetical protein E2F43_12490 [Seongchinamella unica]